LRDFNLVDIQFVGGLMAKKVKVFISYSHKDTAFREELGAHLSLWSDGEIWCDRKILGGEGWDDKIISKLRESDVIIMLLSANFFASEYIQNVEMRIALERHISGNALAIGILIKDCAYQGTPIAKFQLLPRGLKPIATISTTKRDTVYAQVINDIIASVRNFIDTRDGETLHSTKSLGSTVEKTYKSTSKSLYIIPMPYNREVKVDSDFFTSAMPHFSEQLRIFTNLSIRNINEYRKGYEKRSEGGHKSASEDSARMIQQFLQRLCRGVNEVFFTWGGVRTHFRYLHTDKNQYLKLAAVASGEYDYNYGMKPMPSDNICMITKAAELKTPLIYSLNKEWHYGDDPSIRPFKDYVTFVMMDDIFTHRGEYVLSMGISFDTPKMHRDLYYILTLCRFDVIVSGIIKHFADAINVDIVDTILQNKDLIEQGFYSHSM